MIPAPAQGHDLQKLLADALPAVLVPRGISEGIAQLAADFLRRHPDLLGTIEAGQGYLVVSPVSFVPQLLDELRVRVVVARVVEHVESLGLSDRCVLALDLGMILRELRKALVEQN